MPHLYDGAYINLDRSEDRRTAMQRQFDRLGLAATYRRFPAVDGQTLPLRPGLKPGERGIFRSHMNVLALARESGRPLHVLEDDAVLAPFTAPAIDFCIQSGALAKYDIVFTEILVSQDIRALKQFKSLYDKVMGSGNHLDIRRLQVLDLANLRFTCMSSYVVNPNGVSRLLDRYKRAWDAGPVVPVDNYLRDEVNAGRLKAACIFPFVTTIDPASIIYSTAREQETGDPDSIASQLVMSLVRQSFFVGRDLAWSQARLAEILAQTVDQKRDDHRLLLEKAMGFVLSDHFRAF